MMSSILKPTQFGGFERHGDMDGKPSEIYVPGDPTTTQYVEMLWRLANAAAGLPPHQRPTHMFLPASDFGRIVSELRAQHDATGPAPGYLIFGKNTTFKVYNAGTDSVMEVNRLNRETPGAIDFADRVLSLKKEADERLRS